MSETTTRKVESAGLMKYSTENLVPFGPIHPALKEPEYFKLVLEGEKIVEVIPRIGYVHRGLEKAAEIETMGPEHVHVRTNLRDL